MHETDVYPGCRAVLVNHRSSEKSSQNTSSWWKSKILLMFIFSSGLNGRAKKPREKISRDGNTNKEGGASKNQISNDFCEIQICSQPISPGREKGGGWWNEGRAAGRTTEGLKENVWMRTVSDTTSSLWQLQTWSTPTKRNMQTWTDGLWKRREEAREQEMWARMTGSERQSGKESETRAKS